jgi:hypothetical protein
MDPPLARPLMALDRQSGKDEAQASQANAHAHE